MIAPRPLQYRAEALKAPRVSGLLHPALWFILVWALALGLWAGLSDDAFARITGSERQLTTASGLYLAFALTAFVVGTVLGPDLLFLRGTPRRTPDVDPEATIRGLARATLIALGLGGAAIMLILVSGLVKAGGPVAFAEQVGSGVSWSRLADQYFIPSRVQGLTVWVQLNAGVGVLATLGRLMDEGRTGRSRWFVIALVSGFVLSVFQSFALSDRLATNEYVVASAVAFVGYRLYRGQPLLTGAVVGRVLAVVALLTLIWVGGEYGRTYLARYGPALVDAEGNRIHADGEPAARNVTGERLLAYIVTGPNNAMYAVDHFEHYTYVYRTFKGVFTTASLDSGDAPLFGPGIKEQTTLLNEFYRTPEYTVYSFPGYAYMDLSWGGILICFWFGLLIGAVYYRFAAGELWALLIYPFLFVGVLDSWRIFYWSESRMLTCVVFLAVTAFCIYQSNKAPRLAPQAASGARSVGPS
jgi:hypothetical protein